LICFECGGEANERHHVVPVSRGGTKTVPLCASCHGKVHGMKRNDIGQLTKEGIARAKSNGKIVGRPCMKKETEDLIIRLRLDGWSLDKIAKHLEDNEIPPARGGYWWASTIKAVVDRNKNKEIIEKQENI